ncbi:hypothetical protein PE066_13705 [Ramlibacter tataouinensis]|uniref:hypothetical protein n=1 Tax=Ramlibacter tataouinensis TaxID=94132 RepID=UPI0022F3D8A6|nr:hypothetical protein [Ramlibacter tataouinensis]WBY00520.1 hypothetical protein PE066_13705 [Ramlibacter tataouinensis]
MKAENMVMKRKNVDWSALELAYRTGRSFRSLSREFGISSTRIKQVADERKWMRDLSRVVHKAREAKLNAANLNTSLNGSADLEKEIVEATAEVQADVITAHRKSIQRARKMATALLEDLEVATVDWRLSRSQGGISPGSRRSTADKERTMTSRAAILKMLADSLKTLVGLERQAFNILEGVPGKPDESAGMQPATKGLDELEAIWERVLGRTPAASSEPTASEEAK